MYISFNSSEKFRVSTPDEFHVVDGEIENCQFSLKELFVNKLETLYMCTDFWKVVAKQKRQKFEKFGKM